MCSPSVYKPISSLARYVCSLALYRVQKHSFTSFQFLIVVMRSMFASDLNLFVHFLVHRFSTAALAVSLAYLLFLTAICPGT